MGQIYIINEEGSHFYKLGMTRNGGHSRLPGIQVGNHRELCEVFRMPVDNAEQVEAEIKDKYKDKLVKGEWYKLNFRDIQDIIYIVEEHNITFEHQVEIWDVNKHKLTIWLKQQLISYKKRVKEYDDEKHSLYCAYLAQQYKKKLGLITPADDLLAPPTQIELDCLKNG